MIFLPNKPPPVCKAVFLEAVRIFEIHLDEVSTDAFSIMKHLLRTGSLQAQSLLVDVLQ